VRVLVDRSTRRDVVVREGHVLRVDEAPLPPG
jgi:hypothetical protein